MRVAKQARGPIEAFTAKNAEYAESSMESLMLDLSDISALTRMTKRTNAYFFQYPNSGS